MGKDNNFRSAPVIHDLYRLVSSMNATQKRDFKKLIQLSKPDKAQKKYVVLFELIDIYIKEQKFASDLQETLLASKQFGTAASLNALADYLFEKILEHIRGNNETVSPRYNLLLQKLQDIHFLFYNDMFANCYKLICEAKKLALEIDRPTILLELQMWEARIPTRLSSVAWNLPEMQKEQDEALSNVKETFSTFLQSQHLYVALKKFEGALPEDIKSRMERIQAKKDENLQGLPPRQRYWRLVELQYYFELQSIISRKTIDGKIGRKITLTGALSNLKDNLDFMAGDGKLLLEEEPVNYSSVLENYLVKCLELKDTDSIKKLESEFKNNNNKNEEIHRYKSICYFQMLYYVNFNMFEEACKYAEKEDLINNLRSRQHLISDNRMSSIRYTCVQAYFLHEKYAIASLWAQYIIQNPRSQSLPMTYLMSDLIHFICLFETGGLGNISVRINTLMIKYRRREPKNLFLRYLIITFKYATLTQQSHAAKATQQRKKRIEGYLERNPDLAIYGPVLAWIDSRISGKKLAEEILKYNS